MKEQLIDYIDSLFAEVPANKYSDDLRDEITADMVSCYDDNIKKGMSPAAAYAQTISALGNVDELIADLKNKVISVRPETGIDFSASEFYHKPGANNFGTGFDKFFKYITPENEKIIHSTVVTVMWLVITVVYFIINFMFKRIWNVSWLIFLVGSVFTILIDLFFGIYHYRTQPYSEKAEKKIVKKIKGAFSGTLWLCTVIVYFLFSFMFREWRVSWLIFVVAAIIQVIMDAFFKLLRK